MGVVCGMVHVLVPYSWYCHGIALVVDNIALCDVRMYSVVGVTLYTAPLPVSRAARAKLQRLEREKKQLEKTVDTLRHAQAKAEELEKTNKKLHGGAHDSRREIIKLKGVSAVWGCERDT